MSRKSGMPKKEALDGLNAYQRFSAYLDGEIYTRDPWIYNYFLSANKVVREMSKRGFKIRIFRKVRARSFEKEVQEYVSDAADIVTNSILNRKGEMLRHLADVIDRFATDEWKPPVDFERAWAFAFFQPGERRHDNGEMTFAEVWKKYEAACYQGRVVREPIDPAHLRRIVTKEMGVKLRREKAGRRSSK